MSDLTISIFGNKILFEIIKELNLFPDSRIENLDNLGIHWFRSEAWMHLVANEGTWDKNDNFRSQGKLISYVPDSFLKIGDNELTLKIMDPYARYIDDYFVNHIELIPVFKKENERLSDFTKKE